MVVTSYHNILIDFISSRQMGGSQCHTVTNILILCCKASSNGKKHFLSETYIVKAAYMGHKYNNLSHTSMMKSLFSRKKAQVENIGPTHQSIGVTSNSYMLT